MLQESSYAAFAIIILIFVSAIKTIDYEDALNTNANNEIRNLKGDPVNFDEIIESDKVPSVVPNYEDEDTEKSKKKKSRPVEQELYVNLEGRLRKYFAVKAIQMHPVIDFVCSPVIALVPLVKLSYGTSTHKSFVEIEVALGQTYAGVDERKYIARAFKWNLNATGVEFRAISEIFGSSSLKLGRRFKTEIRKRFHTTIIPLDVNNKLSAILEIDKRVLMATRGIRNVIEYEDMPSKSTSLIFVNALSFKGNFLEKFYPAGSELFHAARGMVKIPMMRCQSEILYAYINELDVDVVGMFYESKMELLLILIPRVWHGLPNLLNSLNRNTTLYEAVMAQLNKTKLDFEMPIIKIETKINMIPVYESFGVNNMFRPNADLAHVTYYNDKLHVTKAVQKVTVGINNIGTKRIPTRPDVKGKPTKPGYKVVKAKAPFMFLGLSLSGEQMFSGVFHASDAKVQKVFNETWDL